MQDWLLKGITGHWTKAQVTSKDEKPDENEKIMCPCMCPSQQNPKLATAILCRVQCWAKSLNLWLIGHSSIMENSGSPAVYTHVPPSKLAKIVHFQIPLTKFCSLGPLRGRDSVLHQAPLNPQMTLKFMIHISLKNWAAQPLPSFCPEWQQRADGNGLLH